MDYKTYEKGDKLQKFYLLFCLFFLQFVPFLWIIDIAKIKLYNINICLLTNKVFYSATKQGRNVVIVKNI